MENETKGRENGGEGEFLKECFGFIANEELEMEKRN